MEGGKYAQSCCFSWTSDADRVRQSGGTSCQRLRERARRSLWHLLFGDPWFGNLPGGGVECECFTGGSPDDQRSFLHCRQQPRQLPDHRDVAAAQSSSAFNLPRATSALQDPSNIGHGSIFAPVATTRNAPEAGGFWRSRAISRGAVIHCSRAASSSNKTGVATRYCR
jgi:hypothetical protein